MSVELPEQGEIIIATVSKVMDHGAYVTLDEYDGIQGFLHVSEIAPGWIRSVNKYVKNGEKKVLLVKRLNQKRGDIDLSLKQVSNDQKKKKLLDAKRFEKGKTLLENVKDKAQLSDSDTEKLEESLYEKYDSIYDAFIDFARNQKESLEKSQLSQTIIQAIIDVCSKIKLPSVEIRGVLELTNSKPTGVEIIKKILLDVIKKESDIKITYLGAPKYRLALMSQDFKSAEKKLKPIIEQIQKTMEKQKGTFVFTREESKKTRAN